MSLPTHANDIEFIETQTGSDPSFSVIWLHGLGADGHDFEPIVPQLQLPASPAVRFIFPHAPIRPITINGGMVMRGWYDIRGMALDRDQDLDGLNQSAAIVRELIAQENSRGIPDDRIVLAGFSQGGAIVLHAGLRHTRSLAGILALSTYLPVSDRMNEEANSANQSTPIFMAHGEYDPVIPIALAEQSRGTLVDAGYAVDWSVYPMPHSVSPEEIVEIGRFLTRLLEK